MKLIIVYLEMTFLTQKSNDFVNQNQFSISFTLQYYYQQNNFFYTGG